MNRPEAHKEAAQRIRWKKFDQEALSMPIRIFVDQGHNPRGHNTGAVGNGLVEQDITYEVGLYLAQLLNDDPRFTARLSRPTPDTIAARPASWTSAPMRRSSSTWR